MEVWFLTSFDTANLDLILRLATKNVDSALPDSITEWGVLAISASPDTGQRRKMLY